MLVYEFLFTESNPSLKLCLNIYFPHPQTVSRLFWQNTVKANKEKYARTFILFFWMETRSEIPSIPYLLLFCRNSLVTHRPVRKHIWIMYAHEQIKGGSKQFFGVDTFVQGTVVQGPHCPRDISPRRLLSKETLVQGDYCPRWKFETLRAVHIIFFHFIKPINIIV